MKTAAINEADMDAKHFFELLGKLNAEMTDLHQANKESDKDIEKLLDSNRKALKRIRQNLSHVEANL